MSNALPFSMTNTSSAPRAATPPPPQSNWGLVPSARNPSERLPGTPANPLLSAAPGVRPATLPQSQRLLIAREQIRGAARSGARFVSYEVALELDFSEFHFARLFRAAFGCSPHGFYRRVRAEVAYGLLGRGLEEADVARRMGFRRPGDLRNLLHQATRA